MLLDNKLSAYAGVSFKSAYDAPALQRSSRQQGEEQYAPITMQDAGYAKLVNSAHSLVSSWVQEEQPDSQTSRYVWLAVNFFTSRNFELFSFERNEQVCLEWMGAQHRIFFCVTGVGDARALLFDRRRTQLLEEQEVKLDFGVIVKLLKKYMEQHKAIGPEKEQLPVRVNAEVGRDGRVRVISIIQDVRYLLMENAFDELDNLLSRAASTASNMMAAQLLAYLSVSAPARKRLNSWTDLRGIVIGKLQSEGHDVHGEMVGLMD